MLLKMKQYVTEYHEMGVVVGKKIVHKNIKYLLKDRSYFNY